MSKNVIKRIIKLSIKDNKKIVFLIIVMSFILSILPVLSLNTMQELLNQIQMQKNKFEGIQLLALVYIALNILEILIKYLQTYCSSVLKIDLNIFFDNLILKKVSRLKLRHYEDSSIYDIINRADNEIQERVISIFSVVISIITGMGTIILFSFKVIEFSIWLLLVIIILPTIQFFVNNKLNKEQYEIAKNRTNDSRKSWYYHYIMTSGDFFKEIKINNLFDYFIKKFNFLNIKFNIVDKHFIKKQSKIMGCLEIVEYLIDGFILYYIIKQGYYGKILIGDIIIYTRVITVIKSNFKNILNSFSMIKKESLYVDLFFEFYDLEEEENGNKRIDKIEKISMKNVSFNYKNKKVLNNINFELSKGESVAIVGVNGSGKTTLSKIIAGYYDDYDGEYLINGINFKTIDRTDFRENVSYMLQDYIKYEATLRENISINSLEYKNNDFELKQLISKFGLRDIFSESEDIYLDLPLGYWFDNGRQISIGQWSKIALLRAYTKTSDIIILDEPNASLDPLAEYKFSKLILEILKDKIAIIITHRLFNIVENVDYVIFIEDGEIKDIDNHKTLMRKNKKYYEMYKIQERE